jgi:hypothetical protein
MKSKTSTSFRRAYKSLPKSVRDEARKTYKLWKSDPYHNSLNFELISAKPPPPLWSVRVTLGYRALGFMKDDTITWVWIGTHSEYEKRI